MYIISLGVYAYPRMYIISLVGIRIPAYVYNFFFCRGMYIILFVGICIPTYVHNFVSRYIHIRYVYNFFNTLKPRINHWIYTYPCMYIISLIGIYTMGIFILFGVGAQFVDIDNKNILSWISQNGINFYVYIYSSVRRKNP